MTGSNRYWTGGAAMLAALLAPAALSASDWQEKPAGPINITDPWLKAWQEATPENPPADPVPGVDYGMNPDGSFRHPASTRLTTDVPGFPGQLEHWDQKSYAKNVEVIAFYPAVTSPWHAWANVVDFGGRRYLYTHDRDYLRILDVTDPRKAKIVWSKGGCLGCRWIERGLGRGGCYRLFRRGHRRMEQEAPAKCPCRIL